MGHSLHPETAWVPWKIATTTAPETTLPRNFLLVLRTAQRWLNQEAGDGDWAIDLWEFHHTPRQRAGFPRDLAPGTQ